MVPLRLDIRFMKLKRLTLDNYGLYRGTVTFDLEPSKNADCEQPVILFGGQNGAGKTTLFDAFRVVLYGKVALGPRTTDVEYKEFLKNRIHKASESVLRQKSAYIELEFEYVPLGTPSTYVVRRAWEQGNGKNVTERLSISQDGVLLQNVSTDYWQGFIEEIIPQRLSTLFFFDGEKIKSIAEDENNEALAESIKTLLGLDVVDRLYADLGIYKMREISKMGSKEQRSELESIEREIAKVNKRFESSIEDLAENQSWLDAVGGDIARAEMRLKQEGYVFAQEREQLIVRRAQIEGEIENVRQLLKSEYEGLYPFSLCPNLNARLRQQLSEERQQQKASVLGDELQSLKEQLRAALENEVGDTCASSVGGVIEQVIQSRRDALAPPAGYVELHSLSSHDALQLISWMDDAEAISGKKVEGYQFRLDDLTRILQEVQVAIDKAPTDAVLEPLVEELNRLNARRGALRSKRQALEAERSSAEQAKADLERKYDKVCAKISAHDEANERIRNAEKVQQALVDYAKKLTRAKIEELQIRARDCFNKLSRKGNLIEEMKIDPETFSVTLKDRFGNILPKEDLSAGEKQMYAVAMLWGLSLTSGRTLPVIIDTPLGRLDSAHRKSLVSQYFPKAADQVIVLSTDTEIDKQWYAKLSPWISRSYMLASNIDENCTIVEHGYFWKES